MMTFFGHSVRTELLLLYVIETLVCFLLLCVFLPLVAPHGVGTSGNFLALAVILAMWLGPVSGAGGLYQIDAWWQIGRLIARAAVTGILLLSAAGLTLVVLDYVMPGNPLLWGGLPTALIGSIAAVAVTRVAFVAASRMGKFTRRIAVVRDMAGSIEAEKAVASAGPYRPFEVTLVITPNRGSDTTLTASELRAGNVWAVVVADNCVLAPGIRDRCKMAGVRLFTDSAFCECHLGQVDLDRLPDEWIGTYPADGLLGAFVRRSFDVLISLVMLVLLLPVCLLVALAIKCDSAGPILYHQDRVGRHGQIFTLLKFRSMRADAEAGGTPQWATRGDARVTGVGRFIRLTRVDEIPQLLNVLRGHMAFIGPRPERPEFVTQLTKVIPHYQDRASVRPGITGWAQINYPYGASVEDARRKLSYDLYYLRKRSLFLDLLILIATVRVVLFQEGSR